MNLNLLKTNLADETSVALVLLNEDNIDESVIAQCDGGIYHLVLPGQAGVINDQIAASIIFHKLMC